ncbi:TPA: hypothetical protein ACTW34_003092 [Raoultella planticola]
MSGEDSMTVTGNGGSDVHWGGGSGNGNNGGAGSNGVANVAYGGVMEMDSETGYIMIIEGAHPINPGIGGVPWADDKTNKSAVAALNANKSKPAKFKANIQNWKTSGTGSLDSPEVGKSSSSG